MSASTRRSKTSLMAIGWHLVLTHDGVVMTGSTSVKCRIISKLTEPDPMITAARSSVTGTVPAERTRPTSCRLDR